MIICTYLTRTAHQKQLLSSMNNDQTFFARRGIFFSGLSQARSPYTTTLSLFFRVLLDISWNWPRFDKFYSIRIGLHTMSEKTHFFFKRKHVVGFSCKFASTSLCSTLSSLCKYQSKVLEYTIMAIYAKAHAILQAHHATLCISFENEAVALDKPKGITVHLYSPRWQQTAVVSSDVLYIGIHKQSDRK